MNMTFLITISLKAKICELVVLKLLSSLTLENKKVISAEKDHSNDMLK